MNTDQNIVARNSAIG